MPTEFAGTWPLCLLQVSGGAGSLAALSRFLDWRGDLLPPPAAAPGAGVEPKGAGAKEPECVATGYSGLTSGPPRGRPASQYSVSRAGTGYETRKWLGATFVPPPVAPLLCPGVEDVRELGWKQRPAKNPWGRERHFRL